MEHPDAFRKVKWSAVLTLMIIWGMIFMPQASFTAQEKRTALIIGNSGYESTYLANPVNDANDIAKGLEGCGFTVFKVTDADRSGMRRAIRKFGEAINRDGGVGLFYYAGHGVQVNGENYLVPIGSDVNSEDEVEDQCLKVSSVLRKMETAGNRLNIIVLDACRNNPFARSYRSSQKGLARMDAPTGSILAYATAPGSVAADGAGRNGLYTAMLLKFLEQPGIEIGKLFRMVRIEVLRASGKKQVPWESSSLTGEFYFVSGKGLSVASLPPEFRPSEKAIPVIPTPKRHPKTLSGKPIEQPKLIVIIEENYSGFDLKDMRLAETEMISLLREKGFEIVDQNQLAAANQQAQAKQALAGNLKAAKALGLLFGAQYIVLGKAAVHNSGEAIPDSGFNSLHASLQLKILQCQSGRVLGSVVKQGVAAHINPLAGATAALKKVSKKAVNGYVENKIRDSFQDFEEKGLPLKVHVVGVKSYSQYKEIVDFLESLRNVESCRKEGWNRAGGVLVLDLRYRGNSENLADAVDRKKIEKGNLMVDDIAPEKLDLSLKM
jgi:hypothetical protein